MIRTYPRPGGGWSAAFYVAPGVVRVLPGPGKGRHFATEQEALAAATYVRDRGGAP